MPARDVLAIQSGDPAPGVRLIAAATRQDPTLVGMHAPGLPIDCQENLPRARAALGEQEFPAAWEAVWTMSPEQAIADALQTVAAEGILGEEDETTRAPEP
jgi:hypothetical protein